MGVVRAHAGVPVEQFTKGVCGISRVLRDGNLLRFVRSGASKP